jgi:hypothetical protein
MRALDAFGSQLMEVVFMRGVSAAAVVLHLAAAPRAALADAGQFEFRLVEPTAKVGDGAIVSVRLVDRRSGSSVPGAVIFARRIDMAPDGMATMTAPLEPQPSDEPGVYRFKTDLAMEGRWRLSLAAKVQGEPQTVVGTPVLEVRP